jgi:hypothetical protein
LANGTVAIDLLRRIGGFTFVFHNNQAHHRLSFSFVDAKEMITKRGALLPPDTAAAQRAVAIDIVSASLTRVAAPHCQSSLTGVS